MFFCGILNLLIEDKIQCNIKNMKGAKHLKDTVVRESRPKIMPISVFLRILRRYMSNPSFWMIASLSFQETLNTLSKPKFSTSNAGRFRMDITRGA